MPEDEICQKNHTEMLKEDEMILAVEAAKENIGAVLPALKHGVEMIRSAGSAACAEGAKQ
jgi:hypothetical protein